MGFFTAFFSAVTLASVLSPPATPHGVWPLAPHAVDRGFEPPSDAFSPGHRGVDLQGTIGSPVMASLGGTVSFAGVIAGRGVVVVGHGDTRTTYEPVIAKVRLGDAVEAGDELGTLEVTQSHCFPSACLHWGWRQGETYLDPLLLVQGPATVRLLPLMPEGGPGDTRP